MHLPLTKKVVVVDHETNEGDDLLGAIIVAEIVESVVEDTFIGTDTSFDTD